MNAATWEHQCRSDGLAAWINDWLVEDKNAFTLIGSNGREWQGDEDYNRLAQRYMGLMLCTADRQEGRLRQHKTLVLI